ncbi:MAG TPA: hypothetical protein VMV29_18595, partial [Ktedonobacterales bacterium]|nr:hypothetical protein [Ktedonobacterales bacterium]
SSHSLTQLGVALDATPIMVYNKLGNDAQAPVYSPMARRLLTHDRRQQRMIQHREVEFVTYPTASVGGMRKCAWT